MTAAKTTLTSTNFPHDSRLPKVDLEGVASVLGEDVLALHGQRIFLAGCTGFVGRWMVEGVLHAAATQNIDVELHLLTRSRSEFAQRAAHLATSAAIVLHEGNIATADFPVESFDYVVHGANPASAAVLRDDPLSLFDALVGGTRRILDFSVACKAKRVLFLSSGAVYGAQPPTLERMNEDFGGPIDVLKSTSAYAEGKRAAEMLCTLYRKQHALPVTIARLFAFVGPLLPLDTHFAVGNFVRDVLAGETLTVQGDGRTVRSYLYGSDMAAWLWKLLLGEPKELCYNVGSSEPITIGALARLSSEIAKSEFGREVAVDIRGKASDYAAASLYVPDTERIMSEFNVTPQVSVREGLIRMMRWVGDSSS